jgi:hypothetical protein
MVPDAGLVVRRFGVGLACTVVALIILGQVLFLVKAARSGAWTSAASVPRIPTTGSLSYRLSVVLSGALGSSDRGVRRFEVTRTRADTANHRLSTVGVRWAINNDLSAGTIGNGAVQDVYLMLRDIFTSGLRIATVNLSGTYPMRDRLGHTHETVVMRLAMTRRVAAIADKTGWDNLDSQTLWPLTIRHYVNAEFQPLPSD